MSTGHDTAPAVGAEPAADAGPADSAAREASATRRLVAAMLLVVAVGAFGLVALGAAADHGPGPVYTGATERSIAPMPNSGDYGEPVWEHDEQTREPQRNPPPSSTLLVALIVLGAILLAAAVWVMYRMWKLARPPLAIAGLPEEELTPARARAALEDARARLSTVVDAHDAVIAAWLALERAIAAAGVRRHPSQTTLEFVVAVLGDLELDRTALDRLAHLYRRAMFDPQPLVEADRDEAQALLERLTDELGSGTEEDGGR